MTNRNHNLNKKQKRKAASKNSGIREERRGRMGGSISTYVSILGAAVSVISTIFTIYFANKEYEYKVKPEVTATTSVGAEAYLEKGQYVSHVYSDGIKIHLLDKNNLAKAYLIYADNRVEKLDINEEQETLEEKLNEYIKTDKYNLKVGDKTYQYWFLFLESLDGSSDMMLIYTKLDGNEFTFDEVSGVEVWGMANSNPDDQQYEGERIMAEQYLKILKESADYKI